MKEKIAQFFRSNEKDLEKEIQRVYDALQELKPGTKEYADTQEAYNNLLDREEKLKGVKKDITKVIWAGGIGIAGVLLYRILIDKSGDPFFRDIARGLLKIVHV